MISDRAFLRELRTEDEFCGSSRSGVTPLGLTSYTARFRDPDSNSDHACIPDRPRIGPLPFVHGNRNQMKYRLLLITSLVIFAGCSSTPDDLVIQPADDLYREANQSIEYGNYQRAERQLRLVLARYPFTEYAAQAHMDILFVYLQLEDPESLVEEADRFIRENPRHPNIDYVYYMKGMGYYRVTQSRLEGLFRIDSARRDISNAETAFRFFSQLTSRYPESPYTADARLRMIELRNRIARHEMHVANYYLERGAWISAIQRANRVLRDLQGTPAETDALIVLARAYEALGLDDLAATPRRILAANPGRAPVIVERD